MFSLNTSMLRTRAALLVDEENPTREETASNMVNNYDFFLSSGFEYLNKLANSR